MARKLQDCEHCKGKKQCMRSGGRSCDACRQAAGRGPRDWATVRCSVCGGMGKVWVETEEAEKAEESEKAE
jgi:hypothetical protein